MAAVTAALIGCQSPPPAPIAEREQPPSEKITTHIVSSGETLYSVAWRYELDFQRLAEANSLTSPYALYPGQRLSLDTTAPPPRRPAQSQRQPPEVRSRPVPERGIAANESVGSQPKVFLPPEPQLPKGNWSWQWPVSGNVEREYDAARVLKGISIYPGPGTSVASAAPGVVVYAGNGLRGYGNLVIIKHSDKYLSAYAHNNSLLVGENDTVRQGQKIAEVGVDSTKVRRLYFEIRENGKPVDPLKLLPKR